MPKALNNLLFYIIIQRKLKQIAFTTSPIHFSFINIRFPSMNFIVIYMPIILLDPRDKKHTNTLPLLQANIPMARTKHKYKEKQCDKCWRKDNEKKNAEEELGVDVERSSKHVCDLQNLYNYRVVGIKTHVLQTRKLGQRKLN